MINNQQSMGLSQWLLLLFLSLLWGGAFFLAKVAVTDVHPFALVLFRVSIAASVLFLYLVVTRRAIPKSVTVWKAFFVMGLMNNVIPFSLIFWGQTQIASGLASILNATTPIFTLVLAHLLTQDERINKNRLMGVLVSVIGVVIMLSHSLSDDSNRSILAVLACLGAALSYATAVIFGRRFKAMKVEPIGIALGQLSCSSLIMIVIVASLRIPVDISLYSTKSIVSVIILALACTALAYIVFFKLLQSSGANNISLVTILIPVSAVLLGTLILGEQLSRYEYIGMLFISLGLLIIDGRAYRKLISYYQR